MNINIDSVLNEKIYSIIVSCKLSATIKNYSNVTTQASLSFYRHNTASIFKFTIYKNQEDNIPFCEGDDVSFLVNNNIYFKGRIFSYEVSNKAEVVTITCYDDLRYLKNQIIWKSETEVITIGTMLKLIGASVGVTLITTIPQLEAITLDRPKFLSKSIFDIINNILTTNIGKGLINGVSSTCLYQDYTTNNIIIADCNTLINTTTTFMKNTIVIDYKRTSSIGSEVYNRLLFVVPTESLSQIVEVTPKPSNPYNKWFSNWGILQKIEKINSPKATITEVKQAGESLLDVYALPRGDLSFSSIGVLGLRAGMIIAYELDGIKFKYDTKPANYGVGVIDTITHNFKENEHTMDITLKVKAL